MPVWAQQPPDAGQTLQQQRVAPQLPRPGATVDMPPPAGSAPVVPGGPQVVVQAVQFTGNSIYSSSQLTAVLGDALGRSHDLAGLRGLAERISAHYRANGYPFARAIVPAQPMAAGRLRIDIYEGRYGKVAAQGAAAEAAQVPAAQAFLDGLKPGAVIESSTLERATLILSDQPGFKTAPIIRPGQELGTGDLEVQVSRARLFSGEVGLDNHGNRYTGQHRVRANLQWDSPFLFGDQITLRTLYSEENLWLGSLGYSAPLGASGLRGNLGYAHTYYQLGKDFANLQATGTARVSTVGVSYPLRRSQKSNLTLSATLQHKDLNDRQGVAGTDDSKASDSVPLALAFDHRDGLGGGGITYGGLTYTPGRLTLSSTLEAADVNSGRNKRGGFDKLNLDVARVQATPLAHVTLLGRVSAQWAGKNLDSSESFSLGGPYGVRAYPVGEGTGDEGWLMQLEARYALGAWSPYVLWDQGEIRVDAKPAAVATNNARSLAGAGLGLRYHQGPWSVDATVAWRTYGGQPRSDTADPQPRGWVTVGYRF